MAKEGDWWLSRDMGGYVGDEWLTREKGGLVDSLLAKQLSGFSKNTKWTT